MLIQSTRIPSVQMEYVVHIYVNGKNDDGIVYGVYENADEAIEVTELAYQQTGEMFTVTVLDPRTNTLYDTVYVVGAR